MPKDDQIVCVGFSPQHKRAVQMIGVTNSKGTMIYHAMTPPQKSILKELGLERKKR